jgi:hypothetical protein
MTQEFNEVLRPHPSADNSSRDEGVLWLKIVLKLSSNIDTAFNFNALMVLGKFEIILEPIQGISILVMAPDEAA